MNFYLRCGLAAILTASASPAAIAEALFQEEIHADSFDNLVIYSPGGYKRIIVGQGHLAEALKKAQAQAGEPEIVYEESYDGRYDAGCPRYGVLLHGRSYMYGLPMNVVPTPVGRC